MEKNQSDHLSPYRQQLVYSAGLSPSDPRKGDLCPLSVKLRNRWMEDAGESHPSISLSIHLFVQGRMAERAVESLGS